MPELAAACQYPDKPTTDLGLLMGNRCVTKKPSGLTSRMIGSIKY